MPRWRYFCRTERCFAGRVDPGGMLAAFRRAALHSDQRKHPSVAITDDHGHTHVRQKDGSWTPPLRAELGSGGSR